MGNCRYCGKPAGFLRHQHRERREQHDNATAKIPQFFVQALQDSLDADRFREMINQDAAANFVGVSERDKLIEPWFTLPSPGTF